MSLPQINCTPKHNYQTEDCPFYRFCFARMNDPTITGCDLVYVMAGLIRKEQMTVEHTIGRATE